MTPLAAHQHCWNHETREAACRCPGCNRNYCRECVTEHQGRLLCAVCLSSIAPQRISGPSAWRKMTPAAMIVAGLLVAWLTYWALGESVIALLHRMAQQPTRAELGRIHKPAPGATHDA